MPGLQHFLARRWFRLAIPVLSAAAALPLVASLLAAPRAYAEGPRVHAIVGARIVTAPGHVIEHGTILMRDGIITAVGPDLAVPADARIWREENLTVYPGLIDAEVTGLDATPAPPAAVTTRGAPPP